MIVSGVMEETLYRPAGRHADGRVSFERYAHRVAQPRDTGGIRPPLEYHEFGNAGEGVARTVHVYGGNMARANTYRLDDDGWWTAEDTLLAYDD
jgi:hypothetical protein